MQIIIHDNSPDAKFDLTDKLNLKEGEAIVCIGMDSGKGDPHKPTWKTIRFSTNNLKSATFKEEVVEIASMVLTMNAKYYGWTDEGLSKLDFDNPKSVIPFLKELRD